MTTSFTSKYTSKLVGKRVLVFGGTSGIGFCVAEACLHHGAIVTISGSSPTRLEKALHRLRESCPAAGASQVAGHVCNLNDKANLESSLDTLLRKVTQEGKVNHIAFTAGDALKLPSLAEVTTDRIEAAQVVRLYSVIILGKLIPQYMDLEPGNSFTLTGGTNTDKPMPNYFLAAATGGAIEALTRAFAGELRPMRVNMVSPGGVYTELFQNFGDQKAVDGFLEHIKAETTVGEYGKPEEVAEAYVYAMKDRFASGAIINSNGGRLLA